MKNKNYEKKAFIQIFLGYFISVGIFILLLGYLYFNQQQNFIMQKTAMNMHQYILKLKQSNFTYTQEGYSFDMVNYIKVKRQLPIKDDEVYYKAFTNSLVVYVDSKIVDKQIKKLKFFTILLQISLLMFFAIISYILTKKSLKPMSDTISHLDRFIKDLVHDLNTPVTSILLNTRMLKKDANDTTLNKINRIENSAKNISSLYENLEVLLNGTLNKEKININELLINIVNIYKDIYANIKFEIDNNKDIFIYSNKDAIKKIIDNILSNACKYSKSIDAIININFTSNSLIIKDNGKGIKYPNKIFEREYKESTNGHGIGMHIVYRLCDELNHKISIQSKQNIGTIVKIDF